MRRVEGEDARLQLGERRRRARGRRSSRRRSASRRRRRRSTTSPSASCAAVSTDCARRVRRSGFITSRSTTTSIVCLNFLSSSIGSSSRRCSPSTFTRVKPSRRSSSRTSLVLALAVAHDRRVDGEARPLREPQDLVDDRLEALAGDRPAADRAVRPADARVEQAQVVVDLGDGADGRARVPRRRLLVDRDRRREPVDRVDVRLLHHLQELARVGGERLDVAALALRVDRVEGEARLAGAGQARDADRAAFRGSRTVTSLRLCSRAPWTTSSSAAIRASLARVGREQVFAWAPVPPHGQSLARSQRPARTGLFRT